NCRSRRAWSGRGRRHMMCNATLLTKTHERSTSPLPAQREMSRNHGNDSICGTRTLSPAGKSSRPKNEASGVSIAHRRNQRQRIAGGAGGAYRPRLKPNPIHRNAEFLEETNKSFRLARDLRLLHDLASPIHNANAREFQRDVASDIVLHGCPPSQMPGADSTS